MKKLVKLLSVFIIVFIALFFLGPRPDTSIKMTFDASSLPADLDLYLSESEKRVENIVPGAEKEIIWLDSSSKSKTDIAIVYIHGFSATKHEIRPVPENVASALNANLYFTRLSGHGRDGDGLAEASLSGWMDDFHETIAIGKKLGDRVIILNASNGAPISVLGLQEFTEDESIIGMVSVSSNFELTGLSTTMGNIPWAETILPMLAGAHRSWEPVNAEHGKWWTTSYPSRAVFPMMALLKRVKEIDLSTIKLPTLFIYSTKDSIVKPEAIEAAISTWGGKTETMIVDNSDDPVNHVIAGDILSPNTTDAVSEKIIEWAKGL